jgi:hypothetical protein
MSPFGFGGQIMTQQLPTNPANNDSALSETRDRGTRSGPIAPALPPGEAGIITGKKRITLEEYSKPFIAFVEVRSAESPLTVEFYKSCVRRLLEFRPLVGAPAGHR